ncbi:MAG: serine/threonine-protein kinase, partial [Candidatus Promineifilaceae bacterium]
MSQLKQIDRYIIRRLLGGGGMSTVYVAYDPNRDDQVAVKVLRTGLSDDPEMRERFEREARMLAQLHHPAIMPLLDYGEADDRLYFVMPYMRNGSLQERLLAGALPFDEALLILRRIALALDVAHGRSIIHRDIKPHNIIFDDSHMACLADFGIARLVDLNKPQQTVTLVGTPEYMAPEQVVESNISPQTDVYQLGIVMFQMLTGRRPFEGSVHSIMTQHLNDAPPLVEALMPDLPEGCDQVLAKALAKNPEERYTTIGAFAAAVVALQGKQPRQISQEHTIVVPPLFMAGSSAENTPPPPTRQTNIIKVNPQTALPAVNLRKLLWSSMALVTLFAVLAVFSLGNNPRNRNWRGEDTSAETVLVNQAPALLEVNDTALIELPENAQEPQAAVVEQTTAHAADTQNGPTIVIHDEIYSGADVAQ